MSDTINLVSHTLKQSTTALTSNQETSALIAGSQTSNLVVSSQAVITDWQFFILVIATIVFVFWQPQIWFEEFYRSYFQRKFKNSSGKKEIYKSRFGPPRLAWFDFFWVLIHTCLTISIIYYVYNYKFPVTSEDTSKYISIESLFIIMILLEKLWRRLFWNYHFSRVALLFSCIFLVLVCIISLVLIIMYGVVGSWASFGLMLPVLPWYLLVLGWNCYICYCCWSKTAHCLCHFPGDRHHHHRHSRRAHDVALTTGDAIGGANTDMKSVVVNSNTNSSSDSSDTSRQRKRAK